MGYRIGKCSFLCKNGGMVDKGIYSIYHSDYVVPEAKGASAEPPVAATPIEASQISLPPTPEPDQPLVTVPPVEPTPAPANEANENNTPSPAEPEVLIPPVGHTETAAISPADETKMTTLLSTGAIDATDAQVAAHLFALAYPGSVKADELQAAQAWFEDVKKQHPDAPTPVVDTAELQATTSADLTTNPDAAASTPADDDDGKVEPTSPATPDATLSSPTVPEPTPTTPAKPPEPQPAVPPVEPKPAIKPAPEPAPTKPESTPRQDADLKAKLDLFGFYSRASFVDAQMRSDDSAFGYTNLLNKLPATPTDKERDARSWLDRQLQVLQQRYQEQQKTVLEAESYFDIYNLSRSKDVDTGKVKSLWRVESHRFHPDRTKDLPKDVIDPAIARICWERVNQAYQTLSNPTELGKYLKDRRGKGFPEERLSETDQELLDQLKAKKNETGRRLPHLDAIPTDLGNFIKMMVREAKARKQQRDKEQQGSTKTADAAPAPESKPGNPERKSAPELIEAITKAVSLNDVIDALLDSSEVAPGIDRVEVGTRLGDMQMALESFSLTADECTEQSGDLPSAYGIATKVDLFLRNYFVAKPVLEDAKAYPLVIYQNALKDVGRCVGRVSWTDAQGQEKIAQVGDILSALAKLQLMTSGSTLNTQELQAAVNFIKDNIPQWQQLDAKLMAVLTMKLDVNKAEPTKPADVAAKQPEARTAAEDDKVRRLILGAPTMFDVITILSTLKEQQAVADQVEAIRQSMLGVKGAQKFASKAEFDAAANQLPAELGVRAKILALGNEFYGAREVLGNDAITDPKLLAAAVEALAANAGKKTSTYRRGEQVIVLDLDDLVDMLTDVENPEDAKRLPDWNGIRQRVERHFAGKATSAAQTEPAAPTAPATPTEPLNPPRRAGNTGL